MDKLLTSASIYIGQSEIPHAGRGVYATRAIRKGGIIERCPVILIPKNDLSHVDTSFLVTYFFYFGKKKEQVVIALGFGSIYNHSYQPNAHYKIKLREKILEFVALQDIKKDTEITINYKQGNTKRPHPLWFEAGIFTNKI